MDDGLHEALHRLAERAGQPPPLPSGVVKRARRRLARNLTAGALGLAVLGTVGIAGILHSPPIDKGDEQPKPITSTSPSPGQSASPRALVFVYSFHGDIYGAYQDGTRRVLVRDDAAWSQAHGMPTKPAVNPTVSPDKRSIVFQLGHVTRASLVDLDLRNGSQCCFRDGAYPTFSSSGIVARVVRNQYGARLSIAVGVPTSEAEQGFPLSVHLRSARDLSWDRTGEKLFFRGIYRYDQGPVVNGERLTESLFEVTIRYEASRGLLKGYTVRPLIPTNRAVGEAEWGPSLGHDLNVLRVCCDSSGLTRRYSHIELGTIDTTTDNYTKTFDLDELGIDLQTCDCRVLAGPPFSPRISGNKVRWIPGGTSSWFVGDGRHLWWIGETGRVAEMPFPVTSGVGVLDQFTGR